MVSVLTTEMVGGLGEAERPFSPGNRRLSAGLLLSITIIGFESLGVSTALPTVSKALQGDSLYGWAFSAFLLGQLLGTVLAGTDADRHGPRRAALTSLVVFGSGLVVSAFAPTMLVVVIGRALAGLGAGAALMLNFAVIGTSYSEATRPKMIAASQGAWILPAMIGPAIAGPIAEHVSWRLVFGGLVPLLFVVAWLQVPVLANRAFGIDELAPPHAAAGERFWIASARERIIAAFSVTLGGAGLVIGFDQRILWRVMAFVLFGGILCAHSGRTLFPKGVVSSRQGLPSIVLAFAMLLGGFIGIEAFFPKALSDVRGLSAFVGGVFLSTGTVFWSVGAWLQGKRTELWIRPTVRTLSALVFFLGVVIAGVGVVSGAPLPLALAGWLLAGLGMGTTFNAITEAMYRSTPPERIGAATSATQLGGSLVAAVATGTNGAISNAADRAGWTPRSGAWSVLAFEICVVAFVVFAVSRVRVLRE